MHCKTYLLVLCLALVGVQAEEKCPTTEYACHDVIDSSRCLMETLLNPGGGNATTIAQCVEYAGSMSDLPGATKVSECE
jgi:hypothetical protein